MLAPVSLEAQVREAGRKLSGRGTPVELKLARLESRNLDEADVVITSSAAGLAAIAPQLAPGRVSFGCADEIVLVGAPGLGPIEIGDALTRAATVVLADPRGPGAAAEAALARVGQRAAVAAKLRYVAGAPQVVEAAQAAGAVGLLLRSDLAALEPPVADTVAVIASGFDGARECPAAAPLLRSNKPALANALIALLKDPAVHSSNRHSATRKD